MLTKFETDGHGIIILIIFVIVRSILFDYQCII